MAPLMPELVQKGRDMLAAMLLPGSDEDAESEAIGNADPESGPTVGIVVDPHPDGVAVLPFGTPSLPAAEAWKTGVAALESHLRAAGHRVVDSGRLGSIEALTPTGLARTEGVHHAIALQTWVTSDGPRRRVGFTGSIVVTRNLATMSPTVGGAHVEEMPDDCDAECGSLLIARAAQRAADELWAELHDQLPAPSGGDPDTFTYDLELGPSTPEQRAGIEYAIKHLDGYVRHETACVVDDVPILEYESALGEEDLIRALRDAAIAEGANAGLSRTCGENLSGRIGDAPDVSSWASGAPRTPRFPQALSLRIAPSGRGPCCESRGPPCSPSPEKQCKSAPVSK